MSSILSTSAVPVSSRRVFFCFPSLVLFFFNRQFHIFLKNFLLVELGYFRVSECSLCHSMYNAVSLLGVSPMLFSRVFAFRHSVLVSESPTRSNKFHLPAMLQRFSHHADLVHAAYLAVDQHSAEVFVMFRSVPREYSSVSVQIKLFLACVFRLPFSG